MPPTRRAARPKGPTTAAEGLLLVDKPAGVSSHDVVAVARRALREKRIGHAGTLDPFATGLLILLLGRATRLMRYVHDEPKRYEAVIAFGAETDTEDPDGAIVREAALPSRSALADAARKFIGIFEQSPPAYSAKHVDGERSYDLARSGRAVALAPVTVTVHACALDTFEETGGGVAALPHARLLRRRNVRPLPRARSRARRRERRAPHGAAPRQCGRLHGRARIRSRPCSPAA